VIDTLAYPEETREIKEFLEEKLECPVRYLINTHHHADHSLGNHWFPHATVVSSESCRRLLDTKGREALEEAKLQNRELSNVQIVLPDVTFEEGHIGLRTGKRTLKLIPLPGHSEDGMGVLVVEDNVLFSGDIMMPIPYILDGDIEVMTENMKKIPKLKLENLVQGHGEVILRGEVGQAVKANINYLTKIQKHAKTATRRREPEEYLLSIDVESCGKNRILLNGLAEELHRRNLFALYERLTEDEFAVRRRKSSA
jgi:glyoxylase-like metal-dependent hydrolase (beta-lactamase superfamily II)